MANVRQLRKHKEWFRPVLLRGRKSCPNCNHKLPDRERVWSWGQYNRSTWKTIMHFCKHCFIQDIKPNLERHVVSCDCSVELVAYSNNLLPEWLNIDDNCNIHDKII